MIALCYILRRLKEASTWGGIALAIAGGQGFTHPWDYVAIACGTIAIFCPQPGRGGAA